MDDSPREDHHGRKRKGSLRKTVLLGVERLRDNRRTSLSSGSSLRKSPTKLSPSNKPAEKSANVFSFELPNSSTESHDTPDQRRTSTTSESASATADENEAAIEANTHDIISPTSTHTSAVSDDDGLTFPMGPTVAGQAVSLNTRPKTLIPPPITSVSPSPSPPSSESSGLASFSISATNDALPRRRRSTLRAPSIASPLTTSPPIATLPPIEEEWDYSDTEWWGWIILIVTWIVFVVGMGSCLGVWSWAWDVGETPYAPPELEDDPTLPIVGYYPALLVLTAVMSWVWVVVAWVGLKYFKHAKMGVVEDG